MFGSFKHRLVDFFFQAGDGILDKLVTGVQTCALPIYRGLALYQLDRYEAAVAMLASIHDPAVRASVALPLADSYLKLNQPQKAKDVLLPHFYPERRSEEPRLNSSH